MFALLSISLALAVALVFVPGLKARLVRGLGALSGAHALLIAGLILLMLLFVVHEPAPVFFLGLVLAACVFVVTWIREFIVLMRQPDSSFPGRNDKLIWALFFLVVPPIGVIAFWSFRRAHWSESKTVTARLMEDYL